MTQRSWQFAGLMLLGALVALAGELRLPHFAIQLLGLAFILAVLAWVYVWMPRGG